ncbi:MAG: polyribonucleotide nucleotidyltransferase [Candidatus Omnitrophica bacterium]|nr:polyribonucleotide nucleotidyltransferase [Candidatus Omnitrophota bacterium]
MQQSISTILGREKLSIETGKMARQADGAVTIQLGGTMVLVTCVASRDARKGTDFLPLTVEYQEKTYAAGKIPGGFFKREGRPSEKEILTARLIDRPIRPLFPSGMVNDIQVAALVLSSDGENDSDVLALNGASTALMISNIPFNGPIGCVRVGLIDGKLVLNPTFNELESSELDLIVVGTGDKVMMMEAESKEITEEKIEEAIEFARPHIKAIVKMQDELAKKISRPKRKDVKVVGGKKELYEEIKSAAAERLKTINTLGDREKRRSEREALTGELIEKFTKKENPEEETDIKFVIEKVEKEVVRKYIAEGEKRVDKRALDEIRPIRCETGLLPRAHGSGLFTRGETQALCATTLGTSDDEQRIDALEGESHKAFMLHYNFPAFSVGEVRPFRGPGRREIGHGALAEKSLKHVMPSGEKFPYTVRIVSDILESNGSSSMASVCAGSMSLMNAGVPVKEAVAGIAMGLVDDYGKKILLTDIAGVEDHYGDMDFKVAGTAKGITAVQVDLKIKGIDMDLIKKAFKQARSARLKILEAMNKAISGPQGEISDYAPKIINIKINPGKIKDVVGPGGRIIKKIIKDTGATINIEDDGTVQIASTDNDAAKKALDIIKGLTAEAEIGKIYKGKITRLMGFGAFCEIFPGKEGLIRVSELANKFVKDVASEVSVGDEVTVKVIEVDPQGRINLSKKQAESGH